MMIWKTLALISSVLAPGRKSPLPRVCYRMYNITAVHTMIVRTRGIWNRTQGTPRLWNRGTGIEKAMCPILNGLATNAFGINVTSTVLRHSTCSQGIRQRSRHALLVPWKWEKEGETCRVYERLPFPPSTLRARAQ